MLEMCFLNCDAQIADDERTFLGYITVQESVCSCESLCLCGNEQGFSHRPAFSIALNQMLCRLFCQEMSQIDKPDLPVAKDFY